jgi:hypothetical protein
MELAVEALAERTRDMRERAELWRRARSDTRSPAPATGVTIRSAGVDDGPVLRRLAQLDEAPVPTEPVLLAEVEGVAVAALSVEDGGSVADPFVFTDSLVRLLCLRARQLRGRPAGIRAV